MRFLISICAAVLITGGCAVTGPTLPKETIPTQISPNLRNLIEMLYGDAGEAATAVVQLREMPSDAKPAIPYLVTMLDDTRLAERTQKSQSKISAVGIEVAKTLAVLGTDSMRPVLAWLKDHLDHPFARGNVAWVLKMMPDKDPVLANLQNTEHALTLISALEACTNTGKGTGLSATAWDINPYYRITAGNRGGIFTYIEVMGKIKDRRAVPVLNKIIREDEFDSMEKDLAQKALAAL